MATNKTIDQQALDLIKKFSRTSSELDSELLVALESCGILVETQASLLSPVDTGLLRKSITHRTRKTATGGTSEVGTNVEYAPFQEFGTVKMAPQPFLTPALNEEKPRVTSIITQALRRTVDNAGR